MLKGWESSVTVIAWSIPSGKNTQVWGHTHCEACETTMRYRGRKREGRGSECHQGAQQIPPKMSAIPWYCITQRPYKYALLSTSFYGNAKLAGATGSSLHLCFFPYPFFGKSLILWPELFFFFYQLYALCVLVKGTHLGSDHMQR